MSKETAPPQGFSANKQLKALFDEEVKAVKALIIKHNLIAGLTPVGDYVRPQNEDFAAPAIVIAGLLSGYWVGSPKIIFEYASHIIQFGTRIDALDIGINKEGGKPDDTTADS